MRLSAIVISAGICMLAGVAGCSSASASGTQAARKDAAHPGFAVVELFTSEGCSSCPPADELLASLTREAANAAQPVYTLSFHVDYWNNLGWRDPFSAAWASARQRSYAQALGKHGIYTPQMIVNGRHEFIGSHATEARDNIAAASATNTQLALKLTTKAKAGASSVTLHYELSRAAPESTVLNVALLSPEVQGTVHAGENAGRELRHVHVVRAFETHTLGSARAGDLSIAWPRSMSKAERDVAELVAYVQHSTSMVIVAADESALGHAATAAIPKHATAPALAPSEQPGAICSLEHATTCKPM